MRNANACARLLSCIVSLGFDFPQWNAINHIHIMDLSEPKYLSWTRGFLILTYNTKIIRY